MRLDQYLYQNGLAGSRERARALIMAGIVYINDEKAVKAGMPVKDDAMVEVRGNGNPYVSRGGLKLEKAIQVFSLTLTSKICMDIGASTGGFTDCMLQNGADKVYAVDVGYGQLAWKLRCDNRVVVMERTNIRKLDPAAVPDPIDFFSIDVSFISLELVLPAIVPVVQDTCEGVCLVKPQFEAGKGRVGKKGVVREAKIHLEVLHKAVACAIANGFSVAGLDYSPVKGPEGNIEFLMYVKRDKITCGMEDANIDRVVETAHQSLQP